MGTDAIVARIRGATGAAVDSDRVTALVERVGPYLLLAPALIFVGLFLLYPILRGLYMSFYDRSMLRPGQSTFVGLQHYRTIFGDPGTAVVLWNTFLWVAVVTVLAIAIGFAAGWLLYYKIPYTSVAMGITLIPWIVPGVVGATLWNFMFSVRVGVFNELGVRLGLIDSYVSVLGNPEISMYAPVVGMVWRMFPLFALLTITGLEGIDTRLYEAAEVDGATPWEKFRYITLPQMRYVMVIGILLMAIFVVRDFEMIWVMTGGGPGVSSSTLPILAYRSAFVNYNLGMGAAISTVLFVIVLIFSFFYLRVYAKVRGDF